MRLRVRCLCCDDGDHVIEDGRALAPSPQLPPTGRAVGRDARATRRDARRKEERRWQRAKKATSEYGRRLRKIGDQVDELIRAIPPDDPPSQARLEQLLHRYADLIEPWARANAAKMIADTAFNDEAMWATLSREMGLGLRQELAKAPTGALLKERLEENVVLITSLPRDAATRVHELALKRLEDSGRAKEIADEIMRTGEVTKSRATLIARTEVARVASGLIEARATHIGSEGYIWRTSMDADVRNTDGNPVGSHRLLEGKFIRWDSPPVAATNGTRAHAGQIYNCRCWPEPVIPEKF